MPDKQTIKKVADKAKGLVIPTGLIIAIVVGVYGKQILGWPLTVDSRLSAQTSETADIRKDVEGLEEADEEQKEINKSVDNKLDDMVKAQNTMNIEQAKQGVTLENIGETLKRMEATR